MRWYSLLPGGSTNQAQPISSSRRKLMSVYTPAITSSSTMPAPPGNRSNLFVGNTLAISKKRNNRKHQSKAVNRGGARKLATRKPTISSMTMTCGSFCFRILAPLSRQPYRAEDRSDYNRHGKWKVAHGDVVKRERERNGNKSSDGPWEPGKISHSRAGYEKQYGSLAKCIQAGALLRSKGNVY